MNYKKKAGLPAVILIINFLAGVAWVQAESLDRIVAIAEEDVILDSELNSQVNDIVKKMAVSNMQMPPKEIVRRQVLERIIIDKLQSQLAKRSGIRVSDEMLENYIADIAQRNEMSPVQFKEEMKQQGINVSGPYPADTVFTKGSLLDADAVLAMYHDQGLPVLKHVGFNHAINTTLGLPIIRTSVDHGTALHLTETGNANPDSLFAAINSAITQSKNIQNS